MEAHNYLGLYINAESATVVCVNADGAGSKIVGCFTVSTKDSEEKDLHTLAGLIKHGCLERQWQYSDVTVSLNCTDFMQHSIHSEFNDKKKIAATVRFDTEDALATDASDVAIAFQIVSGNESGSDLNVFTAKKNVLSDILSALKSNGMDPVSIEPDVMCLAAFVSQKLLSGQSLKGGTVFAMLSARNGYLVIPPADGDTKAGAAETVRTFLLGSKQNRSQLLQREVLMTTAVAKGLGPMNRLMVFDTKGAVDSAALSEKLGVEVESVDLPAVAGENIDGVDPVEFALACGAALNSLDKYHEVNFRDDFMPYQGGKRRLENALKVFSICVTILIVAIGLYFQMQLRTANKEISDIHNKLSNGYLAVMGQKLPAKTSVNTKLGNEIRRLRAAIGGVRSPDDNKSPAARLNLIFTAILQSRVTGLEIDTISISDKSMSIIGSAANKGNTLKFETALKETGLGNVSGQYSVKGGRDQFNFNIKPGS